MLTYRDHFKFGYNHEWFRSRQSTDDEWMVSYGPCERPAKSFREECYETASLIYETTNEPITVLFSGGIDSEVVVRSFCEQNIPIKIAICQFSDNLNWHDINYAIDCCGQLGIGYDLISLDINKFLENDIFDYAKPTRARIPELCTTMWLADQVDGVPVIGSGDCYLAKRVPDNYLNGISPYNASPWDLYEREAIASWYRHFMIQGRDAVPAFFQYTPEIMLSFLCENRIIDLVNNMVHGELSTNVSKFDIYAKHFSLKPRKKYSGFETVYHRMIRLREHLHRLWPASGAAYLTEYHDLIGMLDGTISGPKGRLFRNLAPQLVLTTQKNLLTK